MKIPSKILFSYSDWVHLPERKRLNEYGGVGYYRIIKVAEQVKKLGHEVTIVGRELATYGNSLENQWDNIFKEYDVFWTSYFPDDKIAGAIFYHAQKHNKKVVLDCDDNYLDVPENNPHHDVFSPGKKTRAFISAGLSFADVITVSTEPLKAKLLQHFQTVHGMSKKIVVIPNMNDVNDWNYEALKSDDLTIGYSGSTSHFDDIRMVLPALVKVMTKFPKVQLRFIGSIPSDKFDSYFHDIPQEIRNRIALVGATATFKQYPEWLASQGWDIGIAPLVDTEFTRCKSSIKWMEYSMFKIPVIASRVYPYFMPVKGISTIIPNQTGLLVRQNQWEDALEELITDEAKRKRLGENAFNFIKDKWQYNESVVAPVLENL